ncbi:MAG: hypothetical protein ACLFPL_05635 [Candidatus Nanoarchaeia archaeon]
MAEFSDTPLMEITLRRYESAYELNRRETLRKICLSLGLLQPGDSRDVIVDILLVLENVKSIKKELNAYDIKQEVVISREKSGLSTLGTADSNIRRQLKRLRDMYLVEKVRNNYRITEFQSLKEIYETRIKPIILNSIVERNKEYFEYYLQFENKKHLNGEHKT